VKSFRYSIGAKTAAILLFLLTLGAAFGGTVSVWYMAEGGYYKSGGITFYEEDYCGEITRRYADSVFFDYFRLSRSADLTEEEQYRLKQLKAQFAKENTNFFFAVTDETGRVLLSNYEGQNYGLLKTFRYEEYEGSLSGPYAEQHPIKEGDEAETRNYLYFVNCYVRDPIEAADDYYTPYRIFQTFYALRHALIPLSALSALLAILLFVFLLRAAGHKKGTEEIVLSGVHKLPLDLYAAGIFVLGILLAGLVQNVFYYADWMVQTAALFAAAVVLVLGALALCMTFAARVKKGKWWKNTVLCRIILLLRRVLRALFHGLSTLVSNLPLLWKSILIFLAYLLINGITLLFLFNSAFAFLSFLFGILFNVAVFAGLCFLTLQLNRLKEGGARIASGDYSVKIDTTNMLWDLKSHGEALNNIGQGMLKAVDERLRSERLKTELITNVSHDIKTPLTSIVNYVDLLKKEPLESETAREYIEVLDRQSQRLKKLVEDLLEASKASAGSIQVSTSSLDIVELLNQSLGEYTEQFSINGLEPIIRTPPEPVRILADGKLMWRVFDNLLNNICKYSLPHTRVYFDVDITDRDVSLTLKNISRYPLNISADELMERFVRGDTARTTEGSGLGLSIAKSLIELQKGGFTLSVDGDLFKATIRFPRENHAS